MKKTKIIALIYSNIIIWLALSLYVSTVFDAGASQDKHEGAVPVLGTAETQGDIVNAEERERICELKEVFCDGEAGLGSERKSDNQSELRHSTSPSQMILTSCYTGVESHGKNGIIDGVSVATYRYPQGTKLFIEGIGERIVQTVTAKRLANRVDIWWGSTEKDYRDCLAYGVQLRNIKVIE